MPIAATEYKKRRNQLMRMMGDRAIAIVPGAREKIRNRDTHYPFRQESALTRRIADDCITDDQDPPVRPQQGNLAR